MEIYNENLEIACEKFKEILKKQLSRVEDMKAQGDFTDYDKNRYLRWRRNRSDYHRRVKKSIEIYSFGS